MLKIKRTGGGIFYLRRVTKRTGPHPFSNGTGRRDAAGAIDYDAQWERVRFTYDVLIDRQDRDSLWALLIDASPTVTGASATNAFSFYDDEILTAWTACTLSAPLPDFGERAKGRQETYAITLTIECVLSTFNTNRRSL